MFFKIFLLILEIIFKCIKWKEIYFSDSQIKAETVLFFSYVIAQNSNVSV